MRVNGLTEAFRLWDPVNGLVLVETSIHSAWKSGKENRLECAETGW